MSDPSQTHAQGESPPPDSNHPVRDRRVAVIVDLKMRLAWKRRTAQRLAEEWGVTQNYVYELAVHANRVVRRACVDPDTVAAELLPPLMATFQAACRSVRAPGGDPHAQAKMAASAASLAKILVDVAGLDAPKKTQTELSGPDGGPVRVTGPLIFTPPESSD